MNYIPQRFKKKAPEICHSCEYYNYNEEFPNCTKGINLISMPSQMKDCSEFDLKPEFVEKFIKIEIPSKEYAQIEDISIKEKFVFLGRSNSISYSEINIWGDEYKNELLDICLLILKVAKSCDLIPTIASLDIETTNWIPSAMQGYVNIICQSVIQKTQEKITLSSYQIINMNRKPENVGHMLQHVWNYLGSRDLPSFEKSRKKEKSFPQL